MNPNTRYKVQARLSYEIVELDENGAEVAKFNDADCTTVYHSMGYGAMHDIQRTVLAPIEALLKKGDEMAAQLGDQPVTVAPGTIR